MLNDLLQIWETFDANHDNKLDYEEWKHMARFLRKKYPLASASLDEM
jgi:hypothetical protein